MNVQEIQQEALCRAQNGQAVTNYSAIYSGFMEKGIPQHEILPRENVFTFNAWKALKRHVRKGEHGVKVSVFVNTSKTETDENGTETTKGHSFPRTTTVFHISQTDGK